MTGSGLLVTLAVGRVLGYLGFVLFAGILLDTALVSVPSEPVLARGVTRLRRLGMVVLAVGAVISLVAVIVLLNGGGSLEAGDGGATGLAPDLVGGGAIARLAVLAGTAFWLRDLSRAPITRARRGWTLAVVGALALTVLTATPMVRESSWLVGSWAAGWELVGLAGLVGALVIIAVLAARPATLDQEADRMIMLDRLALVVWLSSAVVALGAVATLVIGLTQPNGSGPAWPVVKIVGVLIMIGLATTGVRRLTSPGRPQPQLAGRLFAGALVLGAAVMIISSWLPGQLV